MLSTSGLLMAQQLTGDYPIQPVAFTQVHLTDNFWRPRLDTNAKVTIPYILQKCREEGRINNFLVAAGKKKATKLTDFPFDDTDLYKLLEGASYSLQEKYDAKLDREMDTLIQIIGDAQEPDGYLYTFRTAHLAHPHEWIGTRRWEKDEELSHELYNCGHLYEAAVAHYAATGKKAFLNIAIKNADLLVKTFGPDKLHIYPGHQIVELGLVKMYRVTGKKEYLDLAKFFLDVRGPGGDVYNQADKKVVDQTEAEGHAVRATYMYTGMADVAALTGDKSYLHAIDTIWNNVADKKLYITGGIGATGNGEAFGPDYDLPNMSAYAETCASIANVYWNLRMFLLHGDAKYMDVLERTLYNGLLSGISLSGNRFFYPNPLASVGQHQRSAWFSCACCITNMTRFLPSMPGYIYAQDEDDVFVNLFVSNNATIKLPATEVKLTQQTDYPWQGKVSITVDPVKSAAFALHIRIPGWAVDKPIPSDLYSFISTTKPAVPVYVNGKKIDYITDKGYAVIDRTWKKGDKITIDFPMEVEKVTTIDSVKADKGRFALQRGPIVYCLEGADQQDSTVQSIVIDTNAVINAVYKPDMLNGITTLTTQGYIATREPKSDNALTAKHTITAIPYYSWNNRGSGEMEVWIPYTADAARPKPQPTIASKAKVTSSARGKLMTKAVNDQFEPADSKDQSTNYLHWWPAKDTTEWVQYDFDKAYTISESKVYWYDDKPWGGCDLPASWQLLYKKGDEWVPVKNTTDYEIAKDKYDSVQFEPVTTTALRLVVQLPKNDASGIHEWIVK
ncbi:glycoside hydrolase family 127 protein [Ilyomonas limi]|uniref:Glycoside hydrolase family 127 protein n=2 Tax=Ilyomonas limi TaxID=2575867 RepID=A0A4U3KWB8_9BACT|nr:glycoside hydrolase family 127 protein [Ilyomonas limi]